MVPEKWRKILSEPEYQYLLAMKKTGLFGDSIDETIAEAIRWSIRRAVESKLIPLKIFDDETDD